MKPEELMEELKRNAGGKEPRPCRKCGKMWTPGDWNFYDLCDSCFSDFDKQKMTGRFACVFTGGRQETSFESATEWIKATKGE